MDTSNNWTIVIGVATLLSLIFYWSKQAYLDPIIKNENAIRNKVKQDISDQLEHYKEMVENVGEEKFVDDIYDIILMKKNIRYLKEAFESIIFPGIILCIFAIIFVSISNMDIIELNLIIIYVGILLFGKIIYLLRQMKRYQNQLSRYLEGEDPTEILFG